MLNCIRALSLPLICLFCVWLLLIVLPVSVVAAPVTFKMIVQADDSSASDCMSIMSKFFKIQIDVSGYGVYTLEPGVCAGWFDFSSDGSNEEWQADNKKFAAYQYNAEDARYGADTATINLMVSGDKVWIDWKTVPQGSGLHVEQEYRVYQKGKNTPLVSRNIKTYAKSGWSSQVNEHLTVNKFTPDILELQVDSSYSEILGTKQPLYYWDENIKGYIANVELRTNVRYGFSANGVVDILDARIFYKQSLKNMKSDVARYFHVDAESLSDQEGDVYEIHLDKERYEKLFAPVRHDIARSLHELLGKGSKIKK